MCRNIKVLFNFDPPATSDEIREASLQYVRKLSGFQKPSGVNEKAFNTAVDKIAANTQELFHSLATNASKRDRDIEKARAKARNEKRFPKSKNIGQV